MVVKAADKLSGCPYTVSPWQFLLQQVISAATRLIEQLVVKRPAAHRFPPFTWTSNSPISSARAATCPPGWLGPTPSGVTSRGGLRISRVSRTRMRPKTRPSHGSPINTIVNNDHTNESQPEADAKASHQHHIKPGA